MNPEGRQDASDRRGRVPLAGGGAVGPRWAGVLEVALEGFPPLHQHPGAILHR